MRLCSFSSSVFARFLSDNQNEVGPLGIRKETYLGGRLVFGVGNSWPQDFLFFVGFFSSFSPFTLGSGDAMKVVSAKETVACGG